MGQVSETKTSRKGMPYADAEIGSSGRSVTRAFLWRIEHKTRQPGLSLKIARYQRLGGAEVVETTEPRSEVTLNEGELNGLRTFLLEHAAPLRDGAKRYVVINDDNVAQVVARLTEYLSQPDRAKVLNMVSEHNLLPDDILAAVTIRKRQEAIRDFQIMLDEDRLEEAWQGWFQANSWVLGTDCVRIMDDRSIDIDRTADYLVEAYDGHLDVVELKRPGLEFWASKRDRKNLVPSSDLVKAITQAQNYQFQLELKMDSWKTRERFRVPIAKPRGLVVFGRSHDWARYGDEFRAQRLLNAGYSSIQVLTFDQVLRRAQHLIDGTVSTAPQPEPQDDEDPFGDQ